MSQSTYEIDPVHTSVRFSVRHMMVSNVRGDFTKLSGHNQIRLSDPCKLNGRGHDRRYVHHHS